VNPFRWFRRRRLDEPPIEPSPGARLRLAQADRRHQQVTRDLTRAALDEVDRTAAEAGRPVEQDADGIGRAVVELTRRYQEARGRQPADALSELVEFMSKGSR
jgi:hypothetical protein